METEIYVELLKPTVTVNRVKVGRLCKKNHVRKEEWLGLFLRMTHKLLKSFTLLACPFPSLKLCTLAAMPCCQACIQDLGQTDRKGHL